MAYRAGRKQTSGPEIRGLYVDSRLNEYTTGVPHEVTCRLFVVRRVFRLNDTLPDETGPTPRWQWERGGWLPVDRLTGRVSQINSAGVCPFLFDGRLVSRLHRLLRSFGRREKPLRDRCATGTPQADSEETAGRAWREDEPDSECPAPGWQRQPTRVTFGTGRGSEGDVLRPGACSGCGERRGGGRGAE
jgi:hypothetical protein